MVVCTAIILLLLWPPTTARSDKEMSLMRIVSFLHATSPRQALLIPRKILNLLSLDLRTKVHLIPCNSIRLVRQTGCPFQLSVRLRGFAVASHKILSRSFAHFALVQTCEHGAINSPNSSSLRQLSFRVSGWWQSIRALCSKAQILLRRSRLQ